MEGCINLGGVSIGDNWDLLVKNTVMINLSV